MVLCIAPGHAQTDRPEIITASNSYSLQQIREDFEVFRGSLEDFHAGLYWHISKQELDQALDSLEATFYEGMNEVVFYRKLSHVTTKIRCGHTIIRLSQETVNRLYVKGKVFPLDVKVLDVNSFLWVVALQRNCTSNQV